MFGKENYISPRNSQQYFYKISPMMMIQVPNKVCLTVYNFLINIYSSVASFAIILYISTLQQNHVSVGKMDLVWRSKFGDRGRIQTGQLKAAVHIMLIVITFSV